MPDGSLEQMMLSGQSGSLIAAAKAAAHWTVTGAPLVLVAPLIGLLRVSRRFSARSASSRRLPASSSAAALEFGRAVQRDEHGHLRLEDDRLVRLERIVGRPGRASPQHAGLVATARADENDRRVRRCRPSANQGGGFEPVQTRHVDIEKDQRELAFDQAAQRQRARGRADEFDAGLRKHRLHREQVGRLVVNDQEGDVQLFSERESWFALCRPSTGMVKSKAHVSGRSRASRGLIATTALRHPVSLVE